MPRPKTTGRDRVDLKCGPMGPDFFDRVKEAAQSAGETFSDYIRRAVVARMKRERTTARPKER
jgi:hypothetical protein